MKHWEEINMREYTQEEIDSMHEWDWDAPDRDPDIFDPYNEYGFGFGQEL
jgi:hypothetical protein